jgi:hypothetical protein
MEFIAQNEGFKNSISYHQRAGHISFSVAITQIFL